MDLMTRRYMIASNGEDYAVTRESNAPIMDAFWNAYGTNGTVQAGVLSNQNVITKTEALLFNGTMLNPTGTQTGSIFYAQRNNITHFEEFEEFEGITTIPVYCFYQCSKLSGALVIPSFVQTINGYAFSGCGGLTSLVIGNASVGSCAFQSCGFTSVQIGALRFVGVTASDAYSVFKSCNNLTYITVNGECSGFSSARLFANCPNVRQVSFGSNVHTLNTSLFLFVGCDSAMNGNGFSISSWGGVTKFNGQVFFLCKINGLSLPENLTQLGNGAFRSCVFEAVSLPASITSFGSLVFAGCRWTKYIFAPWRSAPNIPSDFFGTATSGRDNFYTGYDTRGSNVLHVPINATGYNTGYWNDPLQNTSKCGFSISYDQDV